MNGRGSLVTAGGVRWRSNHSAQNEHEAEAWCWSRDDQTLYIPFPQKQELETVSHNERLTPGNKELEASKAASHPSTQTHIFISVCLDELTEKAMATHSSTLAWKIAWTEEPGRLQSMGSRRVGHDWATSLSLFTFIHWRRKWQPTPVFLPGESQGRGSLVGCHLWGHTESDMTEAT